MRRTTNCPTDKYQRRKYLKILVHDNSQGRVSRTYARILVGAAGRPNKYGLNAHDTRSVARQNRRCKFVLESISHSAEKNIKLILKSDTLNAPFSIKRRNHPATERTEHDGILWGDLHLVAHDTLRLPFGSSHIRKGGPTEGPSVRLPILFQWAARAHRIAASRPGPRCRCDKNSRRHPIGRV